MQLIFWRQAWTLLPELCKKAGQYDLGLLFPGQGEFFWQVKLKLEFWRSNVRKISVVQDAAPVERLFLDFGGGKCGEREFCIVKLEVWNVASVHVMNRFSIYCWCLCRACPNVCGFLQMTRCNFHMYNICIARVGDGLIYGLLDVTCERWTFWCCWLQWCNRSDGVSTCLAISYTMSLCANVLWTCIAPAQFGGMFIFMAQRFEETLLQKE